MNIRSHIQLGVIHLSMWFDLWWINFLDFRRPICEHVLAIEMAKNETNTSGLRNIPRHFKLHHDCDQTSLRFKGIDRVLINRRKGNWMKILAKHEARWIYCLDTVTPKILNENISFIPLL